MLVSTPSGRVLSALGLLLLSTPALAGEVYFFTVERRGGIGEGTDQGRILIDGNKYRVEHEPPDDDSLRYFQVLVSKDGGEHRFGLDLEQRTFYELEKPASDVPTSLLFGLLPIPLVGKRSVANVRLEKTENPEPETVAGIAARRHELMLSYDISVEIPPPPNLPFKGASETVRGKVSLNAVYWTAEDRSPLPFGLHQPSIHTGFAEIDGKLESALATLRGLAVKQQVTVSVEGDGGVTSQSHTSTTTLQGPRRFETQPALFEVPRGFRLHKPEFAGPG